MLFRRFGAEACLQHLKDAKHDLWLGAGRADGRLKFAIRMLVTTLQRGQQQLTDTNHDGWLAPGRWPAAAKRRESRRMARAQACRREAQIRNRVPFTALEADHQHLKDAHHDGSLEPGTGWCKRVCGEGAWSGGRAVDD